MIGGLITVQFVVTKRLCTIPVIVMEELMILESLSRCFLTGALAFLPILAAGGVLEIHEQETQWIAGGPKGISAQHSAIRNVL